MSWWVTTPPSDLSVQRCRTGRLYQGTGISVRAPGVRNSKMSAKITLSAHRPYRRVVMSVSLCARPRSDRVRALLRGLRGLACAAHDRLSCATTRSFARLVSAAALLGESGRTASYVAARPPLLSLPPVLFVGFFVPRPAIVRLPLRRPISTPGPPGRRGRWIIANGDVKNRRWNIRRRHGSPRSVPARADTPSVIGVAPILVRVEEDIRGSAGSIVDGHSGNDHERRWSREWQPDLDVHLGPSRHCGRCHEQ